MYRWVLLLICHCSLMQYGQCDHDQDARMVLEWFEGRGMAYPYAEGPVFLQRQFQFFNDSYY